MLRSRVVNRNVTYKKYTSRVSDSDMKNLLVQFFTMNHWNDLNLAYVKFMNRDRNFHVNDKYKLPLTNKRKWKKYKYNGSDSTFDGDPTKVYYYYEMKPYSSYNEFCEAEKPITKIAFEHNFEYDTSVYEHFCFVIFEDIDGNLYFGGPS